ASIGPVPGGDQQDVLDVTLGQGSLLRGDVDLEGCPSLGTHGVGVVADDAGDQRQERHHDPAELRVEPRIDERRRVTEPARTSHRPAPAAVAPATMAWRMPPR